MPPQPWGYTTNLCLGEQHSNLCHSRGLSKAAVTNTLHGRVLESAFQTPTLNQPRPSENVVLGPLVWILEPNEMEEVRLKKGRSSQVEVRIMAFSYAQHLIRKKQSFYASKEVFLLPLPSGMVPDNHRCHPDIPFPPNLSLLPCYGHSVIGSDRTKR